MKIDRDPNYITVRNGSKTTKQVTTYSEFFNSEIKYTVKDGFIIFQKAGIDDNKVVKPLKRNKAFIFWINTGEYDIEFKRYKFEKSPNEDVMYFKF